MGAVAPGVPGWVDVGTPDLAATTAFYGGLFGWQAQASPDPQYGDYTIFTLDGAAVAGAGSLMSPDQPPAWMTYVIVADAEATAARVVPNGGHLLVPAFDVGDQGRMAVLVDPTGAALGLWQPLGMAGGEVFNEPGTLTWNELVTDDPARARQFYPAVFDWAADDSPDESPDGSTTWRLHGNEVGSMAAGGDGVARWLVTFAVADCDAAAATITKLGGTIVKPPAEIARRSFRHRTRSGRCRVRHQRDRRLTTMDVSEVLLDGFGRLPGLVRSAVDGLTADQLRWAPAPGANSIGWLVWHLTRVQDHHVAELLDADQVWVSGDWASRFGLEPDPDNTGYAPHAPPRSRRCGRRPRTTWSSTTTRCAARTNEFLRTVDRGRPRPGRRPPVGPAGDARRAAGQHRQRRRPARRPGRLRARNAAAAELNAARPSRWSAAAAAAGAQVVGDHVPAEVLGGRGEHPAAAAPGDRVDEPPQARVLAEHEEVERGAVPGQLVDLDHGGLDRSPGSAATRRPGRAGPCARSARRR